MSQPLEPPAADPADAPTSTLFRRLLRFGGIGCLALIGLGLLCGGIAALGYRTALTSGAVAAATVASAQAVVSATPPAGDRCAPGRLGPTGETAHTLTYGGLERRYVTYVPDTLDPAQPVPLVVSLHGSGADPTEQRDLTQWNVFADTYGFVVVYPEAAEQANKTFVSFPVGQVAPDLPAETELLDVIFLRDVVDEVRAAYCIDPARVYANGFSAGGTMALLLSCRLPGTFAAVGTVSAPYWADLNDPEWCPPVAGVPTISFHGTADRVVPFTGGGPPFGVEYVPFEVWTEQWAARNGCSDAPEAIAVGDDVRGRQFGCPPERGMTAYVIDGGGHTWPGGAPIKDTFLGKTTSTIVATAEMWAFFEQSAFFERTPLR